MRAGACRGGEDLLEERRGAGHVRAPLGPHQRHGVIRVPALHQHRRRTEQQRTLEGIDRAADMRDRRRDQESVAALDQPMLAQLADQGVDRIVTVQHALWAPRRTRRVQDHSDGVGIRQRQFTVPSAVLDEGVQGLAVPGDLCPVGCLDRAQPLYSHAHVGGRLALGEHQWRPGGKAACRACPMARFVLRVVVERQALLVDEDLAVLRNRLDLDFDSRGLAGSHVGCRVGRRRSEGCQGQPERSSPDGEAAAPPARYAAQARCIGGGFHSCWCHGLHEMPPEVSGLDRSAEAQFSMGYGRAARGDSASSAKKGRNPFWRCLRNLIVCFGEL